EFAEPENPDSDLVFKGVVFNEMKGAMSSVPSQLWHTLCKYLYPATTYHFNSGGEPDCIPDLTYEQLQHFYRTHYPPSNAVFMTYGEDPAGKTHVVLAWLLGKSTDLEQTLAAQMLSHILLDNSASPLQQALETTELGQAPSPLCGLEDSQRELAFVCGLEGCELDDVTKVEAL